MEKDAKETFDMTDLDNIISYYRRELKKSQFAIDYLRYDRQLTADTINFFKLGYAPPQPLYNVIYHDRIMIPVKDILGDYVAFTSRTLIDEPSKYMNSFETSEYQKGRILYGFSDAFPYIQESQTIFLVEGQFDLMTLWQNGVRNVVAGSGTGFTPIHARLLSRYAHTIYLAFDGDSAGKTASARVEKYLKETGLMVMKNILPDGHDPDSYVRLYGVGAFFTCFK